MPCCAKETARFPAGGELQTWTSSLVKDQCWINVDDDHEITSSRRIGHGVIQEARTVFWDVPPHVTIVSRTS
jgi:hypothetical protein